MTNFAFLPLLLGGCLDTGTADDSGAVIDETALTVFEREDIAYDDGTAEAAASPWEQVTGGMVAVRFTPPPDAARLVEARYLISRGGDPTAPFLVRVFAWDAALGEPSVDLLGQAVEAAATAGATVVTVDLSDQDIALDGSDFVVGMEWTVAPGLRGQSAQLLSTDTDAPDGRSYWRFATNGQWKSMLEVSGADADLMIGVTVEVPVP